MLKWCIKWFIMLLYFFGLAFLGGALMGIGLLPEGWVNIWIGISFFVAVVLAQVTWERLQKLKRKSSPKQKPDRK